MHIFFQIQLGNSSLNQPVQMGENYFKNITKYVDLFFGREVELKLTIESIRFVKRGYLDT